MGVAWVGIELISAPEQPMPNVIIVCYGLWLRAAVLRVSGIIDDTITIYYSKHNNHSSSLLLIISDTQRLHN